MISALLLAAGQGRRMNYQAKALLSLGPTTFVQHALQQLADAGMDEIILVTGAQREAVWGSALQQAAGMDEVNLAVDPRTDVASPRTAVEIGDRLPAITLHTGSMLPSAIEGNIRRPPLREAHNPNYQTGILSSIQTGLQAVHPQSEAVLITLVDLPFLKAEDYRAASDHWRRGDAHTLLRACSEGQPAHPVIIPRAYFSQIMEQPPSDKGCSFLFQKYPERVRFHEVARGRIDIDTIEDYHAHITS